MEYGMNKVSGHHDGLRLPIQLMASFVRHDTTVQEEGFTMDLSPGGCCLAVPAPVPVGSGLSIQLHVPGDQSAIAIERAEVCWSMGNRSGIEFLSIGRDDWSRLRGYLGEYDMSHGPELLCDLPDLAAGKRA